MNGELTKVTTQNEPAKKNKLLFVTSIILIITSSLSVFGTVLLVLLSAIAIIIGEVNLSVDFSAAIMGVSLVFGVVLAIVSFYAALRGIWQNKLIKCRKLGIVILLLNIGSYVSDLFTTISFKDSMDTIIFQIVFYISLALFFLHL